MEIQYSTTEWELLAIACTCEHFHTYPCGQSFTVEINHKTLEKVTLKIHCSILSPEKKAPPSITIWCHYWVLDWQWNGDPRCPVQALQHQAEIWNPLRSAFWSHCFQQHLTDPSMQGDQELSSVVNCLQGHKKWMAHHMQKILGIAHKYWDIRDELTSDLG